MIVRGYCISRDVDLIREICERIKDINENYVPKITQLASIKTPSPMQLDFVDKIEECSIKYLLYEELFTYAMEHRYNFHIEFDIMGDEDF